MLTVAGFAASLCVLGLGMLVRYGFAHLIRAFGNRAFFTIHLNSLFGYGAISIVAHYDSIDLEDGVYVGQLDTIVLGADWWPPKQDRLGLNYFNADAENGPSADASAIVGRLQFDFKR